MMPNLKNWEIRNFITTFFPFPFRIVFVECLSKHLSFGTLVVNFAHILIKDLRD